MQAFRLVAADTNFLLSLAAREDTTVDAWELICRRLKPVMLLVPPTAMNELGHKAIDFDDEALCALAIRALRELRTRWHLQPAELRSDQEALVQQAAGLIRDREILPAAERNDALILAEASVLQCALLVSEDSHLLDVDHAKLERTFADLDLSPPLIVSPGSLLKEFAP
jgi:predicted nucleic acid-binding protein